MAESDWIETIWSDKYQTCVSRLIPLVCEFDDCQKETKAIYEIGCVRVCLVCYIDARKPIICQVCEEETDCEYVKNGDTDDCCGCNDTPINKQCSNCFSGYMAKLED